MQYFLLRKQLHKIRHKSADLTQVRSAGFSPNSPKR